jgi:hypothetical protein
MLIVRDNEAKALLDKLSKSMEYKESVKGFFRKDSYLWTIFHFKVKKSEYVLKVTENVQHEGYCIKKLKLTDEEINQVTYK